MQTLTLDQVEIAQVGVLASLNGHAAYMNPLPPEVHGGNNSVVWVDLIESLHNTKELSCLARALAEQSEAAE